jgi:hypothetical protein
MVNMKHVFTLNDGTFISDARDYLYVLLGLCLSVIVVGSFVLRNHLDEDEQHNEFQHGAQLALYGDDSHSRQFLGAVSFTLIISLPTIIDLCLSLLFLTTFKQLRQSMEFSRIFIILVIFIPNIFIFWRVVPAPLVDLIIYCQYVSIYFALIYRLYTLSTATQNSSMTAHVYPVRDVFVMSICAILLGFLFKLSTHGLIAGRFTWKVLYTVSLVLLECVTCLKLKPWFNFTWRISKVVKNHILLRNKISFLAAIFGIVAGSAMTVAHLVTFNEEFVYFPRNTRSFIAQEWLFCAVLIFWTAVRNFDIRKSQVITEVSHRLLFPLISGLTLLIFYLYRTSCSTIGR